jgi:hypothetical protein
MISVALDQHQSQDKANPGIDKAAEIAAAVLRRSNLWRKKKTAANPHLPLKAGSCSRMFIRMEHSFSRH